MILGLVIGLVVGLALGLAWHSQRQVAQRSHEAEIEQRLVGSFAELSGRALQANTEQFLQLAEQRMKQAQESAVGDLTKREQAIDHMLQPLRETLEKYDLGLHQLEKDRQSAYEGLTTKVTELRTSQEQLQRETQNLVTALRSPATRGRWGEVQLRRVVEMAGMVEHCDFDEQVSAAAGEEHRIRPDMMVHVPGGGQIIVDAKVPLDAYLRALDADTEDERRAGLLAHARQVRAHVDQMAKKEYWKSFDGSAEQMVVFVPGDALLAAAYEYDATLQEYAMTNGIVLTTPMMLIALLRTVAFGWRQEVLAGNARVIQQLAVELYERLRTMGGHMGRMQKSLSNTVGAFNDMVGSFESRVMVTARKFPDLGVGTDELAMMGPVEAIPRLPAVSEAPDE